MKKNLLSPEELLPGEIAVLGMPFDENSSFLRGPASAPRQILDILFSEEHNSWTETGFDLQTETGWQVINDLKFLKGTAAFEQIEEAVSELLIKDTRVITLGGDHSITYPIMRAYAQRYADLSVLQLDAHPDLYDELDGSRDSHACPFARIMEEKLVRRLVQVGVRTMTGHQREQAERFAVETIEMRDINKIDQIAFNGAVYLSLDVDCLDPAFAPGVSHHEPGGLSTRDVLKIIHNLKGNLVGADIVEFNPLRDPLGITAAAAAKLLKEIIGRMLAEKAGLPGVE